MALLNRALNQGSSQTTAEQPHFEYTYPATGCEMKGVWLESPSKKSAVQRSHYQSGENG